MARGRTIRGQPTDVQRAVFASVLAAWRAQRGYYQAQSSGERVTLASLYRAQVLERRPRRGQDGEADASYEYRPSDRVLRELGESGPSGDDRG